MRQSVYVYCVSGVCVMVSVVDHDCIVVYIGDVIANHVHALLSENIIPLVFVDHVVAEFSLNIIGILNHVFCTAKGIYVLLIVGGVLSH